MKPRGDGPRLSALPRVGLALAVCLFGLSSGDGVSLYAFAYQSVYLRLTLPNVVSPLTVFISFLLDLPTSVCVPFVLADALTLPLPLSANPRSLPTRQSPGWGTELLRPWAGGGGVRARGAPARRPLPA